MKDASAEMRSYWDERATENALWYVDTSLDYKAPDMDAFMASGRKIASTALDGGGVQPAGRGLAVEIGPGLGRVCKAMAPRFDQVLGIDVSAEMVRQARALVTEPNVRFEVGNGRDLSGIPSESADFVLTFTVLQHLPGAELIDGYLSEAGRILKPGGVVWAQWNNLAHPRLWRARIAMWQLRSALGLGKEVRHAPQFAGTRYPVSRVMRVLGSAGCQVDKTEGLGTLFAQVWATKA